jgi:Tfp pilus assembly protein PilF
MKTTQRLLVVFAAALVMLSSTGCSKLQARDHLNKGVQAYKNSKFEQAIDHFQQAVALDTAQCPPLSGDSLRPAVHSGR